MKLNQVKSKCIAAGSADALTDAIAVFLKDASVSEAQFISLQFSIAAGTFSALIVYAT